MPSRRKTPAPRKRASSPRKSSAQAAAARRVGPAVKPAARTNRRASSSRRVAASGDDLRGLYNFIFSEDSQHVESCIKKLQDVAKDPNNNYEASEVVSAGNGESTALDTMLGDLGYPITLSPEQRQVLVTILLDPYFQKMRPWKATASTW